MTAVDIELKTVSHWIGGKLVASKSGRSGVIWNPATGEAQSHVDFASVQDVDEAVANAQNAYPAWRAMPLSRRSEILFRIRELIHAKQTELAEMVSREHGKTLADAKGE